jgi:hypothetical protein
MIAQCITFLCIFLCSMSLIGCGQQTSNKQIAHTSLHDIPIAAWKQLSKKKIYFGHQSVGNNILDGIRDVMKDHPQIALHITESPAKADLKSPVFAHSMVGKNSDPKSKIDEFSRNLRAGMGDEADIAFLKLCFVDILPQTDIVKVFEYYKHTMEEIKNKFPKTTFIHFTVPLTTKQIWLKEFVKGLIGKMNFYDNVKRNEFNAMLRHAYVGMEPFFDLAKLESTFPDGSQSTFTKDGNIYAALVPDYTNDGGHLNEKGRRIVAEHLLVYLAQLSQ